MPDWDYCVLSSGHSVGFGTAPGSPVYLQSIVEEKVALLAYWRCAMSCRRCLPLARARGALLDSYVNYFCKHTFSHSLRSRWHSVRWWWWWRCPCEWQTIKFCRTIIIAGGRAAWIAVYLGEMGKRNNTLGVVVVIRRTKRSFRKSFRNIKATT